MKLFEFKETEVITPQFISRDLRDLKIEAEDLSGPTLGLPDNTGAVSYLSDIKPYLEKSELKDQFIVFQFSNKLDEQAILESSQVNPTIDGSEEEPDMLINLQMQSFHVGQNEDIENNTRATMRITIGKDSNSRDNYFDTVFWTIAAGLNLYNQAKKKSAESKELKADFKKAFGNRPIEIPGGLSKMSFEVVKHKEPKWWQRIFKFFGSGTGKALTSVLGFPAITTQAINALDELLNRLDKSKPKILFKSLPMRLALSQQAKNDYTGGNERIKIGCLNPGFCVLARGDDFDTFVSSDAIYYPSYGKIVPAEVSEADLMNGSYDDPFKNVTYSVFRVGMKKSKLDPTFNFS